MKEPMRRHIASSKKVYMVAASKTAYSTISWDVASRYCPNLQMVGSLAEIGLLDLIFRRVRLTTIPEKAKQKTLLDRVKRKIVKTFKLSIEKNITLCNLHEGLFIEASRPNEILYFSQYNHIKPLLQYHLPQVHIFLLLNTVSIDVLNALIILCKNIKSRLPKDKIIIFSNFYNPEIIRLCKGLDKKRRIIIRFHDFIDDYFCGRKVGKTIVQKVREMVTTGTVDSVETYTKANASALGALYRPNGVNINSIEKLEDGFRTYLYWFSGYSGKTEFDKNSRTAPLRNLEIKLCELYPEIKNYLSAKTVHHESKDWVPYEIFLRRAASSEVCVDLYRVNPEEGFSYRMIEALALNRKIITNRLNVVDEPFYSPERVFLLGQDSFERLEVFLESDIDPIPSDLLKLYDSTLWWTDKDPYASERL